MADEHACMCVCERVRFAVIKEIVQKPLLHPLFCAFIRRALLPLMETCSQNLMKHLELVRWQK